MMSRRVKGIVTGILVATVLTFGYLTVQKFIGTGVNEPEHNSSIDSLNQSRGYNELAGRDVETVYTVSEYNADIAETRNVKRPERTQITSPTIDTTQLFAIWTLDPNGPHADFLINKDHFYVVDYDGDGSMPYMLNGDSLTIYYNDFVQKGRIIKASNDSLLILWDGIDEQTNYVKWPR